MLCAISLIFIASIISSLEANAITTVQAIFYSAYGLIMFYHESKKYWNDEQEVQWRELEKLYKSKRERK